MSRRRATHTCGASAQQDLRGALQTSAQRSVRAPTCCRSSLSCPEGSTKYAGSVSEGMKITTGRASIGSLRVLVPDFIEPMKNRLITGSSLCSRGNVRICRFFGVQQLAQQRTGVAQNRRAEKVHGAEER